MSVINEATVEEAALTWFEQAGYRVHSEAYGKGSFPPERDSLAEVVYTGIFSDAIVAINPGASAEAIDDAIHQITTIGGGSLIQTNRAVHDLLVDGVPAEVLRNGEPRGELIHLIDWDNPADNDFRVVNQFTVVEEKRERRPDIVVFINGLPLAVIELKNLADEQATVHRAWNQFQTYFEDIPSLFRYNELIVASDGISARMGGITTPWERMSEWKTIEGDEPAGRSAVPLEVLIKGIFAPDRLLDLIQSFIVFEDEGAKIEKKIAGYHQFHAVQKAVATTVAASSSTGDRKGGVVWHTQGSGKSLTMLFFAGKLIREAALENPTIVMLTDRNDLDDQLFGTFSRGRHLLRQRPEQAEDRADLRQRLTRASGGVVFTTIQKFLPDKRFDAHPLLSDRRNIVVIADEAHRSQYDLVGGYASHIRDALPNATFVAFTGTPLELSDRDTRMVFGNYIDIYDVEQAVADGATVPIFYESRLVKLDLSEGKAVDLDTGFEEVTEAEEAEGKEKLKSKWTQLEAVVGTPKRLAEVAADLVAHYERRVDALEGKALIVCMSRRICVDLYDQIVALRPEWHADSDDEGVIKVVMTGSAADRLDWQPHIRNKQRREAIAKRFKDPDDPLRLVIVRDMWLTGFDVPSLHTMYVDKPMKGHALMQAIARVNRVFKDKPGGLVVDYLGLADNLKAALRTYTESGGRGKAVRNVEQETNELVAVMLEKLEFWRELFAEFDHSHFLNGSPAERIEIIRQGQNHVFLTDYQNPGFLKRFRDAATALLKAFALAGATDEAQAVRAEVAFFHSVNAALGKIASRNGGSGGDVEHAVRQLVDQAIAPQGVVDIFAAAGLEKPDISILSEGFLLDVQDMPQKNLAVELLNKLLNDEISSRSRTRLVQSREFSTRLKEALARYHNRSIETAQIIEELIALAREMREAQGRGEQLGLTDDELAFYDALEVNDSAVAVLGDEALRTIAREVAATVRNNVTIDWTQREQVRANLRRMVKRVLRKYGYPPDKQERATLTVIEQAELFGKEWTQGPA